MAFRRRKISGSIYNLQLNASVKIIYFHIFSRLSVRKKIATSQKRVTAGDWKCFTIQRCIYRVIHKSCSPPSFPLIINLLKFRYLEYSNMLKCHIVFKFLRMFVLPTYVSGVLWLKKLLFFQMRPLPPFRVIVNWL